MEPCRVFQSFPRPSCGTLIVGAVVISLVVFGILAHQQLGQLAQMGNAAGTYTGVGCWAAAGLIVLGAALLKTRNFCHKNRRGVAYTFKEFNPPSPKEKRQLR